MRKDQKNYKVSNQIYDLRSNLLIFWLGGFLSAWLFGLLASRLPGFQLPAFLASRLVGFVFFVFAASWFVGFAATWPLGILAGEHISFAAS